MPPSKERLARIKLAKQEFLIKKGIVQRKTPTEIRSRRQSVRAKTANSTKQVDDVGREADENDNSAIPQLSTDGHTVPKGICSRRQSVRGKTCDVGREGDKSAPTLLSTAGHTVPSIPTEIRSRRQSVRGTTVDVGREDDENGKSAKTLVSTDGHMVPSIPTGIRSRRQSVRAKTANSTKQVDDVGREADENDNSATPQPSTDGHTVPNNPKRISSRRQSVRGKPCDVGCEGDKNDKSATTLLSTAGHTVPNIPTGIRSRRQSVRGTTVDVGREDDENGKSAKTLLSTDGHMVPSIPTGIRSRRQSVDAKTTNNTKQVDGEGREADENDSSATPQPSTDGRTVPNNPKGICSRRKSVRGKPCDDGREGDKNDKSATTLLSTAGHTVPSIPTGICSRRQSVRGKTCDVGREGDKNDKSATTLLSTAGHTVPSIPTGIRSRRQSVRGTTVDVGREDDENGKSPTSQLFTAKKSHMVPSIPTKIHKRQQSVGKWNKNNAEHLIGGREDIKHEYNKTTSQFCSVGHMVSSPTKLKTATNESESFVTPSAIRVQTVRRKTEDSKKRVVGGCENSSVTLSQPSSSGHPVSSFIKMKPIRGKARTKTDQVQTSKTEFRTTSEYEFPSMHSKLEGSFWQPKGKPINIKGRSSIPQINDRTASSEEHGNESVVTPPKNAIPNMPTTLQSARAGAGADFLGLPLVEASSSVSCKLEADTGPGTVELKVSSKAKSTWSFIRELPLKDLDDFVRSWEQGFRLKSENTPAKGRMRYYNCSRIKVRAKPQCTRQLLAFIPNTTGDVSVSAKGQHSCHEAPAENLARSKLATGDKQLIDKLVGSGIPSMHIKLQLQANNGNFAKGSLNYAVKSSREKLFGTGTMSFGELETWLSSRCAVPDDAREAFIIGKDVDHDNRKFRIIISSKRMLSYLCRFTTIAADCTFKITMQGYPLLVICIIDQMRKAHPVAFACITNQEQIDYTFVFQTLVSAAVNQGGDVRVANFLSDGELALKNAARCVFGQAVVLLNCYFHVKENIIKHFKKHPEMPIEVQEQLKREVALLQIAPTKRHFGAALEVFIAKYSIYESFTAFFDKYAHNEKYSEWYEAALPGVPATNNGVEAINKSIKYNYLKRHKEPFSAFKEQIMRITEAYSDPDRLVVSERQVALADERKAFEYLKTAKKLRTVIQNHQGRVFVYLPGRGVNEVTQLDIENFENPEYTSLDAYMEELGKVARVEVRGSRFTAWICTCKNFFKTNGCAHILVVAVKRKCYTLRAEANTEILSSKKPCGRPKFITKALCRD